MIEINEVSATLVEVVGTAQGPAGPAGLPGLDGSDGLSAYQIAVNSGFVGSISDWLASLKGQDGIQGPAGSDITSINDTVTALDSTWSSNKLSNDFSQKLDAIEAVNFSLVGHTHQISNIIGLQTVIDNQQLEIDGLGSEILLATNDITSIKGSITTINSNITDIQSTLGDIDLALTSILGV